MTWAELNDWLALYDVDPWGEQRADLRSSANALLTNGVRDVDVLFPYVGQPDSDEISVEDEAELIAQLRKLNQANTDGPRTAESETDRVS